MVNAVSAKVGGAKTIVEKFFHNFDDRYQGVFLSGFSKPSYNKLDVGWYRFPLSGFISILFTLFFSSIIKKFYKCDVLLSFNNVNSLFEKKCLTYFHQAKVFDDGDHSLKCNIYRIYFKLKKTDLVIVQSTLMKKKFIEYFNYPHDKVLVVWPGVDSLSVEKLMDESINHDKYSDFYLVPYTSIDSAHKNFEFISQLAKILPSDKRIVITCDEPELEQHENIVFIGRQSIENLANLYLSCTAVLFPSTVETIGLPIFEAITLNKYVCVVDSDYIKDHQQNFQISDRLIISSTVEELLVNLSNIKEANSKCISDSKISERDFCKNDWQKLFGILK
ncbi:glycosyl transferases group 1 family protein [Vibrio sp. HENC-03]|nr:glycosyl transferases group 1 family protein [Vibrio sp. HENC-03]